MCLVEKSSKVGSADRVKVSSSRRGRGSRRGGGGNGMVASQNVENEMYQLPQYHLHSDFYAAPDTHYYALPADIGHPHHICTIHDYAGPVTVPMVSTNSSPPIAMPVQVPPGHVVQQIVDESGTLRHLILSAQHPGLLPITTHNPQHYNAGPMNGSNGPPQAFYQQSMPQGFVSPPHPHFHTTMPPSGGGGGGAGVGGVGGGGSVGGHGPIPTHPSGHSPPLYYKDERTQRQHIKLKKKLQEKQQKNAGAGDERKDMANGIKRNKGMNSVGTSEDGEESSSVQDDEDLQSYIEILSSVQPPVVMELSSKRALLQWSVPSRLSEASSSDSLDVDISESELSYEVLLSDKNKEAKFRSIYLGNSQSCLIEDLKPGIEYYVRLQVHMDGLQGTVSDALKFVTPSCAPETPAPPKLTSRSKNSLQLRWGTTPQNGSPILHYILEYDEGKGSSNGGGFIELSRQRGQMMNVQNLIPATCYRFRLSAANAIGISDCSPTVAFFTLDHAPTQPDPPQLKKAATNSLHLFWKRRPKDDDYNLQILHPNAEHYSPVYNGCDTDYICTQLTRYSDYKFKLKALNEFGHSIWSEQVTFQTLPEKPARPSKPVVKGRIHAHSFRLKWEPPNDKGGADISKYILEVNSGSGYETIYTGTETEAICDKLTPGTTYQLRVSCEGIGGVSNYSDPCTVTTEAISPGQCPVPKLHGKVKSTMAVLRFAAPDYNGGAPILEFEAEMFGPDSNRTVFHKSKDLECSVTKLQPGCEYSFFVRAVNRIGAGLWSDALTVVSAAAPPTDCQPPIVVCKSPTFATVEWQVPQSNGAPITEYRLEVGENTDTFHQAYQGPQTMHEIKNLSPFTTYYFRIQASNSAGYGPHSGNSIILTPAAAPNPVNNPKSEITATSVTLNWHEPYNNGAPITHYNIEYADHLINTQQPVTSYTISDLQPNTYYRFKLQAVNAVGPSSHSTTLKVTTLRLPPRPPKLDCVGVGHNNLRLKWGEGKNPDFTQFTVDMLNARNQEYQTVYRGTAYTCKVTKLQELTSYSFRVCASNDAGDGNFSEQYTFFTNIAPPCPLKPPKIALVEGRTCSLEWMPPKYSVADPIEYLVQFSRLKDQQYKQVYRGSETKCTLENLESGAEYCVRVCPIRMAESGQVQGAYSPLSNFSTPQAEPQVSAKASTASSTSPTHGGHRHRSLMSTIWSPNKTMSELQIALLISTCVAVVAIVIAIIYGCLNPITSNN